MPRRPAPATPVTLKDIARAAGFSRHTVGFVLNGTKQFPPATRDKVLAAAKRLGYRPNASARAVRSGRFRAVGLLLDLDASQTLLSGALVRGIIDRLDAADHHLVVARFPQPAPRPAQQQPAGQTPRAMTHLLADGLILNYHAELPDGLDAWLAGCGMPVVRVNRLDGTDAVRPDDQGAARALVAGMIARGHRRIAYVDRYYDRFESRSRHFSKELRLKGYREAMRAAGLARHEILAPPAEPLLLDALSAPPAACTAALCYSDIDVIELVTQARGRGLRLPQDLLLGCIGDLVHLISLPVARQEIDWEGIGATAVEVLLARLDGATSQPARLVACRESFPAAT